MIEIVQTGDPVLRKIGRTLAKKELPELAQLIEEMRDTMRDAPGVGLAAPQIGQSLQLAVVEDRAEYQSRVTREELLERDRRPVPFHVLVNPKLTITDPTPVEFFEGCLSVEGFVALVPRARGVHVDALDENGKKISIDASGWYARILQHEIDHLNGTLYIDRMRTRSFCTQEHYTDHWRMKSTAEVIQILATASP
jgi:peptide deformylase